MFRKLLAAIGLGAISASGSAGGPPYSPYSKPEINSIYNLLFCDDQKHFYVKAGGTPTAWQETLWSVPPNIPDLKELASNPAEDGRIRYLAYSRIREVGEPVEPKKLLGVIVEMPLAGGLDVLAAYLEGGVRYINQTGKLVVIEGMESFLPMVKSLFAVSEPVVSRIGPWDKPRLAPPIRGNVRLTFLVSDGLYFGEGPISVMQNEAMAGPIIQKATQLLQEVVKTGKQ